MMTFMMESHVKLAIELQIQASARRATFKTFGKLMITQVHWLSKRPASGFADSRNDLNRFRTAPRQAYCPITAPKTGELAFSSWWLVGEQAAQARRLTGPRIVVICGVPVPYMAHSIHGFALSHGLFIHFRQPFGKQRRANPTDDIALPSEPIEPHWHYTNILADPRQLSRTEG